MNIHPPPNGSPLPSGPPPTEEALRVLVHVCWTLGLERDINDYKSNEKRTPGRRALGAWDFARVALSRAEDLEDLLTDLEDDDARLRPLCGCCMAPGEGDEVSVREKTLLRSLRDFHEWMWEEGTPSLAEVLPVEATDVPSSCPQCKEERHEMHSPPFCSDACREASEEALPEEEVAPSKLEQAFQDEREREALPHHHRNLNLREVAEALRVSRPTVRGLINDGLLRAHRIGTHANAPYRVSKVDLDAFLNEMMVREAIASNSDRRNREE